jgi:hypothetical protein
VWRIDTLGRIGAGVLVPMLHSIRRMRTEPKDDMPISDASEPYDIATRSPEQTKSRQWSDRAAQRATRTILLELAELEAEAAGVCDAALDRTLDSKSADAAASRRDNHLAAAREHALRADQLVEMPLADCLLNASLPWSAASLASCRSPEQVLRALDDNQNEIGAALDRALRSPGLPLGERERLERKQQPPARPIIAG